MALRHGIWRLTSSASACEIAPLFLGSGLRARSPAAAPQRHCDDGSDIWRLTSSASAFIKVCGVTSVEDALVCVEAGADVLGLNLYPKSPRCVALDDVVRIREAVGDSATLVLVVVDRSLDDLRALRRDSGIDWLQLHGDEPVELVAELLPCAYKAVRMGSSEDARSALSYPGELLLLDSRVPSLVGGSGTAFDWDLAAGVTTARRVILAGGLTPENVGKAIEQVRPFAVDVASGVESEPGRKSRALVQAFVRSAREAFDRRGDRE